MRHKHKLGCKILQMGRIPILNSTIKLFGLMRESGIMGAQWSRSGITVIQHDYLIIV
jgi:hypothetical protein